MKTRFAPSPNGYLHRGHAYSAWRCWQLAEQLGGDCLVRIEDIDTGRCRPHFETAIFDVLDWLGFAYDTPVLQQSARFGVYEQALNTLADMDLLYPCFATRSDIMAVVGDKPPMGNDGVIYPNIHRNLSAGEIADRMGRGDDFCLRLKMDLAWDIVRDRGGNLSFTDINHGIHAVDISRCGDIVIKRKDTPTSYHLAVVVDDGEQGITHVTRGLDLWHATPIHRVLQVLLGLPEPLYNHHGLILDNNNERYAKRKNSPAIVDSMAQGVGVDVFWDEVLNSPIGDMVPVL